MQISHFQSINKLISAVVFHLDDGTYDVSITKLTETRGFDQEGKQTTQNFSNRRLAEEYAEDNVL
ncbi:hypothetical protein [Lake Baikal phage Baikal-20-5m-C28]|nr:hypothetical protein [Lake Baikal phage Baikal-20-5m-C28]